MAQIKINSESAIKACDRVCSNIRKKHNEEAANIHKIETTKSQDELNILQDENPDIFRLIVNSKSSPSESKAGFIMGLRKQSDEKFNKIITPIKIKDLAEYSILISHPDPYIWIDQDEYQLLKDYL